MHLEEEEEWDDCDIEFQRNFRHFFSLHLRDEVPLSCSSLPYWNSDAQKRRSFAGALSSPDAPHPCKCCTVLLRKQREYAVQLRAWLAPRRPEVHNHLQVVLGSLGIVYSIGKTWR